MRTLRRSIVVLVLGAAPFVVTGHASPASAYCDPGPTAALDGGGWSTNSGCSNSCIDMANTYYKLTHKPAPWACPM